MLVLKRIFPLLAVMTLTGCPYTEGCEAPADAAEIARATAPTDPAGADDEPRDAVHGDLPSSGDGDGTGDGDQGPSAQIDFGAAPTGEPALSTLSCPELAMPRATATVYVDVNATGAQVGSKSAPYHSIAQAFASSAAKGVVYVAAGTYKENLVVPNKDLVVFGGFAPGFDARSNACATVLEAANAAQPVVSAAAQVKSFGLEGVTVRRGARGLLVTGDSTVKAMFTVARCVFAENGLTTEVGGAVALDGVNARIFGSVFRDNKAAKGAAIAGGGRVTLTIDQNLVEHNLGYSDHGGGLYLDATSSKISRNTFRGNATGIETAGSWGGAVIVYSNSLSDRARADFSYNVFTENVAGIGGAVFVDEGATITMSHDLVYRNRSYGDNGYLRGAAIYVDGTGYAGGGSSFSGEYLTVVNNVYDATGNIGAHAYGGGIYVEGFSKAKVTKSIFWNNGENALYVEKGQNELTLESSIGPTACTSSDEHGFVTASAALCKMGPGVFEPSTMPFDDEAHDDYHVASNTTVGAFAVQP